MAVTIKQIAKEANVCRATVDKVLHNRPGVSPELTERVQKVIKELGYQPNIIGQTLKRQNKDLNIAVILLSLESLQYLINGVNKEAQNAKIFGIKITTYVISYPDIEEQRQLLLSLSDKDISGVIVMPFDDPRIADAINQLVDAGIDVITINSDCESSKRRLFIGQNMYQAGRTAGQLVEMTSHSPANTAVITGSLFSSFDNDRFHGFRSYLTDRNTARILDVISTNEEPQKTYEETKNLLRKHPNLHYLFITCGCVANAAQAVSEISPETRIICFDSFPENMYLVKAHKIDFIIDQSLMRQGELAVHYLFEKLCMHKPLPSSNIYMPISIHIRENIDF